MISLEYRSNLPPLVRLTTEEGRSVIVNMAHVVVVKEDWDEHSTRLRTDLFFMDGKQMQVKNTVDDIWKGINHAQG